MRVSACFVAAALIGAVPDATVAQSCGERYVVQPGDSLSALAKATLGSAGDYTVIHEANLDVLGANPNNLRVGMQIFLPCGAAQTQTGHPAGWEVLPDVAAVADMVRQRRVQVVDIRSAEDLAAGVVPGAIWMPYGTWRGPKSNPGLPPTEARLEDMLGTAGLRLDRPIVIVHQNGSPFDAGRGAYVYWVLKSAGASRLALMQGGFEAWKAAGLDVAGRPARGRPYLADITVSDTWRASQAEVKDIASGSVAGTLLDARPEKFFARKNDQGQSLATTLPGAQNRPISESYSALKAAPDPWEGALSVLDRLKNASINWESEPVVSFCNTGELGALNWFYASEVSGIENVKLYPESAKGWVDAGGQLVIPK